MDFEISKSDFLRGLELTQGVVERRNTLPILSNVHIEAVDGGVSVLATDLDVGVRQVCEGVVKSGGAITVNARKLYEIVREAAGEKVRVRSLEGGRVSVLSGRARFELMSLDPKEFPSIPAFSSKPGEDAASMRIGAADFGRMIERTLFAVSTDETRFNLSGVYVENHDGLLRMVATDGHRLAMIDGVVDGKLPQKGVILPRKGLAEVKKLLDSTDTSSGDQVTLLIDGSVAKVTRGRGELFMRLVDGEFPDYRQVIPKTGRYTTVLQCQELLAALRRVAILSTERARGVRFRFRTGVLELQTSNPDLGEAQEEIEVNYSGDELTVGFNARYLIEALTVMEEGERIEFAVSDDVSPGTLRPEGDERYCYVIMPMRL